MCICYCIDQVWLDFFLVGQYMKWLYNAGFPDLDVSPSNLGSLKHHTVIDCKIIVTGS